MKKSYGVNELRRMYLDFFESKGHLVMKSFSLVPHNDNSLLLINAGMAPLKPYFTGQEIPPRRRVTTCQKCVRTGDIENVGKTARHLTFFEMLGNFSFGDYFKHEAIAWSWEFLTKVLGLEEDRLYPSIYGEDEEAYEIWTKEVGVPGEKITRFYRDPETGECDNFWEHGAGPGIRSLSPEHKDYHGIYCGSLPKRDAAYHQGTAWGFLMGGFLTAYMKVHHHSPEAKKQAMAYLAPVQTHLLEEGCIGSISEIFDGDAPHTCRGCYAQAWSVGEILRCYTQDIQKNQK